MNEREPATQGTPKDEGCELGVDVECGMLSFEDAAHFEDVRDCLDARYEAFLDWLDQEYGQLDDDAFEDAVDQLGSNEDQTLLDFLGALPGFDSYWRMYESALNDWLEADGEPGAFSMQDPFNSPVEAALHNELGAIMIGGTIHVTLPNGDVWTFCDCAAYEAYASNPGAYKHDPNDPCDEYAERTIFQGTGSIQCSDYWKMCDWSDYAERRRMKVSLFFTYGPAGTEAGARLDSWKQRNNNKWRRRYIKLYPRVYGGQTNTILCEWRGGGFDKDRPTRRARSRWVTELWDGQHRTFRNEEVHGYYEWRGGHYTADRTLDWNGPSCWN